MANISGLLGTAGGFKGTGVDAPDQWADNGKLEQANLGYENANQQQQSLLTALQAQNGLGNQSSVFNQMQGIANGTGPNPAQAQLANATGANVSNQAALMAGQRGSSANTGMMARQAAQQGANTQQQAAGQAAALQAQQSLGALGKMDSMANTMAQNQIGQTNANTNAAQAHQNSLLNANANQNAIKQSLITATAQQQASGMGSGMNAAGSSMSSSGGDSTGGGAEADAQGGVVGDPGKPRFAMGGGLMKLFSLADGGPVQPMPNMAMGGALMKLFTMADGGSVPSSAYQGQSAFGQYLNTPEVQYKGQIPGSSYGTDQLANSGKNFGSKQQGSTDDMPETDYSAGNSISPSTPGTEMPASNDDQTQVKAARGGRVPAMVSPGEQYLPPEDVQKVAKGANPLAVGERIPGKPKYKGNNYANDTVRKDLEEGGIVIPNSVMQSKHPHWAAKKFVEAHMAKQGKHLPKKPKGMK